VSVPTHTRNAVQDVASTRTFEAIARIGYGARGGVFVLVGLLAIQVARGVGSEQPDQVGALRAIARQPFGRFLVILVGVGLAGYAVWRAGQAILGHTPEAGRRTRGQRVGAGGSAVAYAALSAAAFAIVAGSSRAGSGKPSTATADVLGWPGGRLIVTVAGLIVIGVGLYEAYLAMSRRFLDESKMTQMDRRTRRMFTSLGVVGLLARAVTFWLIGVFVIRAAIEFDPNEAVGLDGALRRLADESYGPPLLVVVAIGLVAFGIYSLADARYHKT
jgi:Domain of Unknown Function (DUF1206)